MNRITLTTSLHRMLDSDPVLIKVSIFWPAVPNGFSFFTCETNEAEYSLLPYMCKEYCCES